MGYKLHILQQAIYIKEQLARKEAMQYYGRSWKSTKLKTGNFHHT